MLDVDHVEQRYQDLRRAVPAAQVYYAVKANPGRPVLERLHALGSSFDVASPTEVEACLAVGVAPERISYGNTIKKRADIARAAAAADVPFQRLQLTVRELPSPASPGVMQ